MKHIKISPIPDIKNCGCDGSSYELKVNSLFHNCEFKWWEEGPENWSELTTYTINMLKYFKKIYID